MARVICFDPLKLQESLEILIPFLSNVPVLRYISVFICFFVCGNSGDDCAKKNSLKN